jgi:peptidyl-prolyl cis-trans isomerase D
VLKFIRRNANAAWVKFMFVAIVLVFIFWGWTARSAFKGEKVHVVARINDEVIEPGHFFRAYNNMLRAYQDVYKDNFKPEIIKMLDLKNRAVDQLIDASLLRQEAESIGLRTSESELRDSIAKADVFKEDGRFNKERYISILRANSLTPAEFEESERQRLLVQKIQDLIVAGVHVGEAEALDQYRLQNERVDLHFLKFDAAKYVPEVSVTDEELQAYYDGHKEEFREPERARIEYVLYAPDAFVDKVEVTDAEIQAYYDAHPAEFTTPEQVHARHILFKLAPNADAATTTAVRQRAEEALGKVKAGEDFAELAKQYSEDSSAAQGGDLGAVSRGQMVKPFEDAAFALAPGATSEIVASQFGLHIIKVDSKQEAATQPLADVRDRIVSQLKQQKAHEMAQTQAGQAREKVAGGETLAGVAGAVGLSVTTPPPFAQTENIEGLGRAPELTGAALATGAGQVGPVVTSPKGFFVFRVADKFESKVPELAAIHDKVLAAARKQRAAGLAKTKAEAALAEVQKSGIDQAATANQLTVEDTGPFTRQIPSVPKIGNAPDLKKEAFRLTGEKPVAPQVYTVGDSAFVVVLKERLPADEEKFKTDKDNLIRQTEERRKGQAMEQFVDRLKKKAAVVRDDSYIASLPETGHPLDGNPRH